MSDTPVTPLRPRSDFATREEYVFYLHEAANEALFRWNRTRLPEDLAEFERIQRLYFLALSDTIDTPDLVLHPTLPSPPPLPPPPPGGPVSLPSSPVDTGNTLPPIPLPISQAPGTVTPIAPVVVPTGEPVSTVVLTTIAVLFGIFHRGIPRAVAAEMFALRTAIKDIANTFMNFAWGIAHSLRWLLQALRAGWERIIKPMLAHLEKLTARIAKIIDRILKPYLETLEKLRQILLDIYGKLFLPIIEAIQQMRKAIALLKVLRVPGMKKLDEKLTKIEAKLIGIITDLMRRTNDHAGILNRIVTLRETLQHGIILNTLAETHPQWINQFWNYQSRPVQRRSGELITEIEAKGIADVFCGEFRRTLLREDNIPEADFGMCKLIREVLLRE